MKFRRSAWSQHEAKSSHDILNLFYIYLGFAVAILLILQVIYIFDHTSSNFNEGWNAYFAFLVQHDEPLYLSNNSLFINNYPPISFIVLSKIGSILGDNIVAGRIIALVSMVFVCIAIYMSSRAIHATTSQAAVGATLFALFNATYFRSYVAANDPQWLAHSSMMIGLLILLSKKDIAHLSAIFASVFFILGLFIKHNLISLPLAVGFWFLLHNRNYLFTYIATSILLLITVNLLFIQIYGFEYFEDIFGHARVYSARRMAVQGLIITPFILPFAGSFRMLLQERGADHRFDLLLLFAALAVPLGILQRAGEGVDYNAHFEALIALTIVLNIALSRAEPAGSSKERRSSLFLVTAPFAIPILGIPYFFYDIVKNISSAPQIKMEWSALIDNVATINGPVACDVQAICYWARKRPEIDFFNVGQQLRLGYGSDPLVEKLNSRYYAAIVLKEAKYDILPVKQGKLIATIYRYYEYKRRLPAGFILLTPIRLKFCRGM